jgi:LysM repeat protein
LAVVSRYFVHAVVLIVAVTLSGYASISKDLPAAAKLRLGVVNAEGLTFGQGGSAGGVELGRAGTIVKPIAIPNTAPVQHTPTSYVVRAGEDLYAIAKKFNLAADEVRWSNPDKLTRTDLVRPGDTLMIPPIPGVVVVVKPNDTPATIAGAYKVDPQAVIDFNYLKDPSKLNPGDILVVPNGQGPLLFPRRASDSAPHMGPFANGKFTYGQCTWYVASRRNVPWTGDAWMWFGNARAMGFPTGMVPEPGAIMVTWESVFYGHVAYVEQVNVDGSFVVSEMNYRAWNVIDTRYIRSPRDVPLIGFIY